MSADDYRALAQLYIDSVNANDEEGLVKAFAEDFLDHNSAQVSGLPPGLEGVIVAHRMLHEQRRILRHSADQQGHHLERAAYFARGKWQIR
jgi:hypothetical protein